MGVRCTNALPMKRNHDRVWRQGIGAKRPQAVLWLLLLLTFLVGAACPPAEVTEIVRIKGEAEETGAEVVVQGEVTGVFLGDDGLRGFYMQQSAPAHRPAGLFVYVPRVPVRDARLLVPGNRIQVSGRVGRYKGQIQLERVDSIDLCTQGALPDPIAVHLPATEQQLQRLEGMLVTIPQPMTVTGNHELGRYGSLLLSSHGRLFRTDSNAQSSRLILDDGRYVANPDPIPYLDASGTRRIGSTVTDVTGVLTRAFDAWRLHPLNPPEFSDTNERPPPPSAPAGALRIAAFNVENYFTSLGERGAANHKQLERQRTKLAAAIDGMQADVLALVEVENRRTALEDLVEQINRRSRTGLHYVAVGDPDYTGTDAIRVALIYRPDRVQAVGAAVSDPNPVHNRPPIAARFRRIEQPETEFAVVAVHFKSKTRCPRSGDIDRGQGCWNRLRSQQAEALLTFLQLQEKRFGHQRQVIVGDLNSYGHEDPLRMVRDAGYADLVARHVSATDRYTYVYKGESGYLDHALVSKPLAASVASVLLWHINADEPAFLGYAAPANARTLYTPQPYRSSDHDPVVVDLMLE